MADPKSSERSRWLLLVVVALGVVLLDQSSKFLAVRNLTTAMSDRNATTLGEQLHVWLHARHLMGSALGPDDVRPLVPAFWSWHYAENTGAAWSFAAAWPDKVRVPFFHVVSLVAILLIGFYYRRLKPDQKLLRVALSLVMGGAIGNLTDRLVRGYVIDFIDWHLNDRGWLHPNLHWPTFNVADTGISVGVALIALDSLVSWAMSRRARRSPAPSGQSREPLSREAERA